MSPPFGASGTIGDGEWDFWHDAGGSYPARGLPRRRRHPNDMAGPVVLGPTTGEFDVVGHDVPAGVVPASKPSRRQSTAGRHRDIDPTG